MADLRERLPANITFQLTRTRNGNYRLTAEATGLPVVVFPMQFAEMLARRYMRALPLPKWLPPEREDGAHG